MKELYIIQDFNNTVLSMTTRHNRLDAVYLLQKRREKVCQEMQIEMPCTSQEDILQRLVRRYLFKLERMKEEGSSICLPIYRTLEYCRL